MAQRGTAGWRLAHYGEPCRAPRQSVPFAGSSISVDARAATAFQALGILIQAEYGGTDSTQTGAYNCRKIGGTNTWSAHAWGLAVDVDWRLNPMRLPLTTVIPASLRAIKTRLKTVDTRVPVLRWGGSWRTPDPMHFEIIATPVEIAEGLELDGLSAAIQPKETPDMIKKGDHGPTVEWWQERLLAWQADSLPEYGADGDFGDETERAIRRFEAEQEINQRGVIDLVRGAALMAVTSDTPADLTKLFSSERTTRNLRRSAPLDDWPAD
ncbi:MAG: M15 family metallopeptidase [Acidimicrobiia bacterium]|nr:M15 family metallopeptidase [Acidimicrobiia bacterium]MDH3398318.1 M15 family metallopeptidase [Acidimicrobiia bacterium]MDH5616939.1 M15 family metallopeptidase [Acidimicrobiia bacterium]